jgi:hypothetical protein
MRRTKHAVRLTDEGGMILRMGGLGGRIHPPGSLAAQAARVAGLPLTAAVSWGASELWNEME